VVTWCGIATKVTEQRLAAQPVLSRFAGFGARRQCVGEVTHALRDGPGVGQPLEDLRQAIIETLSSQTVSPAVLDDWEQTVWR
jgi:hypothetical protein